MIMQHIDEASLSDLTARISYLSAFLDLTLEDGEALRAAKPLVAPLIPAILDAVYTKLLSFDITAKVFVSRNTNYEGETVKDVRDLHLKSPQIEYRKDFLKNYLVKLVTSEDLTPTSAFWTYLNKVAIMHTGQPGFAHRAKRPDLRVEYIHMGLLLGFVVDVVIGAVMTMDGVDNVMRGRVIRALNKVVWMQNDLFARCYIGESADGKDLGEEQVSNSVEQINMKANGVNGVHEVSAST